MLRTLTLTNDWLCMSQCPVGKCGQMTCHRLHKNNSPCFHTNEKLVSFLSFLSVRMTQQITNLYPFWLCLPRKIPRIISVSTTKVDDMWLPRCIYQSKNIQTTNQAFFNQTFLVKPLKQKINMLQHHGIWCRCSIVSQLWLTILSQLFDHWSFEN